MGNCHFKTEFETENVTGIYLQLIMINLNLFRFSFDKK